MRSCVICQYPTLLDSIRPRKINGERDEKPIFGMLLAFVVDIMDVMQTLHGLEYKEVCIYPINAHRLERDTRSGRAWKSLRRTTMGVPNHASSLAIN